MKLMKLTRLAWLGLVWWGLVACQGMGTENAAATQPPLPTATITGAIPVPTATPTPPPAIATPTTSPVLVSTVTIALPPPSPEPATSVPTVAIPGMIGPTDFPANVNPLTGEVVSNPAVLARRPIAIKISNYPPLVRPQAGLNSADLIFEHYAEGGVTRFTAIFYGQDATPVGSIRSGRLIDLEIPKMYDAAFAYSGSSGPVQEMIRNSPFFDRVISPDFGHSGFYRVENPNVAIEHTLFTDTPTLHYLLGLRGLDVAPQFQTGMAFLPALPAGSVGAVNTLELRYRGTNVFWQYNAGSGRYSRWTDGQPHLDANTGQQLSFRNIIVLGAHHEDTTILEDLVDMLTFYDLNGNLLPLAPGNTFFQVVPLGFDQLYVSP